MEFWIPLYYILIIIFYTQRIGFLQRCSWKNFQRVNQYHQEISSREYHPGSRVAYEIWTSMTQGRYGYYSKLEWDWSRLYITSQIYLPNTFSPTVVHQHRQSCPEFQELIPLKRWKFIDIHSKPEDSNHNCMFSFRLVNWSFPWLKSL